MIVNKKSISHKNTTECISNRIHEADVARRSAGGAGRLQTFIISSWNLTVDASQCSWEKCSPYTSKHLVPVAFWSASPESNAGDCAAWCFNM